MLKKPIVPSDYNDKITRRPQYHIADFKDACKAGHSQVHVWNTALKDAKDFFNLFPSSELLKFIAEGGLENLKHQNTELLVIELFKGSGYHPVVDAYQFQTGPAENKRTGYIAFFWNVFSQKWFIKSFKVSTVSLKVGSKVTKRIKY